MQWKTGSSYGPRSRAPSPSLLERNGHCLTPSALTHLHAPARRPLTPLQFPICPFRLAPLAGARNSRQGPFPVGPFLVGSLPVGPFLAAECLTGGEVLALL